MEEEYEEVDKIINKVLESNHAMASMRIRTMCREIAKAALEEGHAVGYDSGYDEGYNIGFCNGAGSSHGSETNS